jgi:hypothetical protein
MNNYNKAAFGGAPFDPYAGWGYDQLYSYWDQLPSGHPLRNQLEQRMQMMQGQKRQRDERKQRRGGPSMSSSHGGGGGGGKNAGMQQMMMSLLGGRR